MAHSRSGSSGHAYPCGKVPLTRAGGFIQLPVVPLACLLYSEYGYVKLPLQPASGMGFSVEPDNPDFTHVRSFSDAHEHESVLDLAVAHHIPACEAQLDWHLT